MVYEKAQAEIMEFDSSDVITTSGGSDPCGQMGYVTCSGAGEEHYMDKEDDPGYVPLPGGV